MVRRPIVWGFLYLLLIPLFAGVYLALPARSFHQPLLSLEPGWVDADGKQVRDHLHQSIDRHGLETNLRVQCGYQFVSLHVTRVEAVDRKARFTLILQFDTDGDDDVVDEIVLLTVDIDPFDVLSHSRRQSDGRIAEVFRAVKVRTDQEQRLLESDGRPSATPVWKEDLRCAGGQRIPAEYGVVQTSLPPMSWLFPLDFDPEKNVDKLGRPAPPLPAFTFQGNNVGPVRFEPSVAQDLRKYVDAISGDPKSASGAGLRMLYLSVVTVTTLGLGDITPLTPAARVTVGAESILGIIFIGLFLNAIASRERPAQSLPTSSEERPGRARPDPEPADGVSSESITDAPDQ